MTKINLQAEPSTYEQQLNALDQAEVHAEYSVRHQRMVLDEKPFFSKNQLDSAVARAEGGQLGIKLILFVAGMFTAYLLLTFLK